MINRILTIFSMVAWFMENINSQPFVVGDTLDATSTYVNIPDTSLPFIIKGSSYFDIDIDFDNAADIRFARFHMSSPIFQEVGEMARPLSNIQFAVVADSSGDFDTLSVGTVVKEHLYWYYRSEGIYFNFYHDESPPPPWGQDYSHGICIKPNTYVGFRKINPSDTLYGWILLDLLDPFTVRSFTISKRIPFSVIEVAENEDPLIVSPNPSPGKITIRDLRAGKQFEKVMIFDMQSKLVFSESYPSEDLLQYDLSWLEDGIYLVIIDKKNDRKFAKFIIQKQ